VNETVLYREQRYAPGRPANGHAGRDRAVSRRRRRVRVAGCQSHQFTAVNVLWFKATDTSITPQHLYQNGESLQQYFAGEGFPLQRSHVLRWSCEGCCVLYANPNRRALKAEPCIRAQIMAVRRHVPDNGIEHTSMAVR
jgi:hypothetical protein